MAVHIFGIVLHVVHQVGTGLGLEYSESRAIILAIADTVSTAIGVIANF